MEQEPRLDFRIKITPSDVLKALGSLIIEKLRRSTSSDNSPLTEPVFKLCLPEDNTAEPVRLDLL